MTKKKFTLKQGLVLLFTLLLLGAVLFLLHGWLEGHFDSVDSMRAYVDSFGLFAPLVLILIQMLQVILPVIPAIFGCAAGTTLFGALGSFLCNYIGICLGSLAAFLLARYYGIRFVKQVISEEKYDRYVKWVLEKKNYTLLLCLSILFPFAPDDFLCYFSGLTKMSFVKFTWIILLAKPWCILLYCIFFESVF